MIFTFNWSLADTVVCIMIGGLSSALWFPLGVGFFAPEHPALMWLCPIVASVVSGILGARKFRKL